MFLRRLATQNAVSVFFAEENDNKTKKWTRDEKKEKIVSPIFFKDPFSKEIDNYVNKILCSTLLIKSIPSRKSLSINEWRVMISVFFTSRRFSNSIIPNQNGR